MRSWTAIMDSLPRLRSCDRAWPFSLPPCRPWTAHASYTRASTAGRWLPYSRCGSELRKESAVAFDESGDVRTLYPTDLDRFFAGPGAAVPTAIESRIEFQRDGSGALTSLTWQRGGAAPRLARRVEIEKREDVHFSSGDIQLAGTLVSPNTAAKHPAIILVHASGAEDREYLLPWLAFLDPPWHGDPRVLTSGAWAPQPATGTRPRSTIWPETSWPHSSI